MGRFRRLLPAAYVMIITSFAWATLFHKELLHTLRGDAISSIFIQVIGGSFSISSRILIVLDPLHL